MTPVLWNKIEFSYNQIFTTWWCYDLIFYLSIKQISFLKNNLDQWNLWFPGVLGSQWVKSTFISSTNVDINKSKTKCVIFNKSNIDSNNVCPTILNGVLLPYVDEFKHLGNLFQSDNSRTRDCNLKRAKFTSIIHSLNQ